MPTRLIQKHPQADLHGPWVLLQLAVLTLPFSPLAAGLCVLTMIGWVFKQRWQFVRSDWLNGLLAGLSLWLVLSSFLAPDRVSAWLGLANFLPLFALFAAASLVINTPQQIQRLGWLLLLGSVPVDLIAIGQRFWGWSGKVQWLGSLVNLEVDPTGNPAFRPSSVFDYTNILASHLILVLSLGLGLLLWEWRRGKHWRAIAGLAAILGFGAGVILLTETRNAWATLLLVGGAYALFLGWWWLLVGLGAIAAATWGAVKGQPLLQRVIPEFIWGRFAGRLDPNPPVPTLRWTQWQFAWDLAQQRPLTGWGLRNFTALYQAKTGFWLGHPHNFYLMLSAETGLLATLALLLLIGWVVVLGVQAFIRLRRTKPGDALLLFSALVALGSCGVFGLLDVTMFDVRINILGWLLLAMVCGVSRNTIQKPDIQRPGGDYTTRS
ncbi:O-antigen ligase [Leptolyngbya sp. FACHB-261]|uniref:O-antigen ligase family protein n=1 Tax=Leptolyngbya sp. FACHB-261 TaxID=2692806 RepID=UPI0016862ECA|nr:O-antigen ligase family protein [Leptolyngbya sp. FACHB-261]MBD2099939.1 O-antigen ligase family protein [Leptolyngbya sp. FACHB-261]